MAGDMPETAHLRLLGQQGIEGVEQDVDQVEMAFDGDLGEVA
jgi:hypothetical protein